MPEDPKRLVKSISIFWVLSILLVVIVVVPLVTYSWKAISMSKDYIEESLRERQLKTSIPAAAHIQNLLDEYRRRLGDLVAAFEVYSNDPDAKVNFENLLQRDILGRYLSNDSLILAYQDPQGNQFTAQWKGLTPNEQAQLTNLVSPMARQCLSSGQPGASPVFYVRLAALGRLSEPAMVLTAPIQSEGRTVAAITGIFLLQSVQDSLGDYSREFTLFVTDDNGNLIFHSNAAYQGQTKDLSTDPIVQRMLVSGVYPTSAVNYNVTKRVDGKPRTYLVTCAPINGYRWLLFAQVDREKYYAPILQLRQQSKLWVLLSIAGALLIGLIMAGLITRPISKLAEVSRDLARGNFSQRADIRSRNEIGDLARAFNAMADDIQDYIQKVEAAARETQQLFMDSIRAIANALDAKDPYTRGHSERVSAYSMIISREYGLDERNLRIMEISSLLHDVGKIGIEDKILRKPGALTAEEFEIMKTHPPKGAQILGGIPQMREIIPGIRHHHEKWSGGGYPDNLKAQEIPVIARIIGVADAFDAMTTNRPYQRAMTLAQGAARINELKETVYDPAVVTAFNSAFHKGLFHQFVRPAAEAKPA
ncbi:MAG: HD domain-containing phosphohydrolase [Acidobacteriota bacterium]